MKMPKPTDDDRARFEALVPDAPGVAVKPMFGNLGAFVNGNMFMGLFGSSVGLRLPEADRAKLLAEPGAEPFGPPDRPLGSYASLPPDWSARKAKRWVDTALADAAALPPKAKKAMKAKKK